MIKQVINGAKFIKINEIKEDIVFFIRDGRIFIQLRMRMQGADDLFGFITPPVAVEEHIHYESTSKRMSIRKAIEAGEKIFYINYYDKNLENVLKEISKMKTKTVKQLTNIVLKTFGEEE